MPGLSEVPAALTRSRRPLGLRGQVLGAFALVTLFAIGLNTAVVWRLNGLVLRMEQLESGRIAARMVAVGVGRPSEDDALDRFAREVPSLVAMVRYDASGAESDRRGVVPERGEPDPAAVISAQDGQVHATYAGARPGGSAVVRAIAPVLGPSGESSGAIAVWLEVGAPAAAVRRARGLLGFYLVLNAVIVGGFGWFLISRTVVRPVRRLTDATRRVAAGESNVRVGAIGGSELGDLGRDFDRMTQVLAEKDAAIVRQLDELRAANQSLRQAREEVIRSEKLASVGRLAAGVAHELGNPVGAVTGYVSALIRGRPDGEDAEILRRIEAETRRIDRIIRDLLDFARPRPELRAPFDVEAAVDAALSIVRVQEGFREVRLERRTEGDGPRRVLGDSHRLEQVLVNLLINAADAVDEAPEKRIEVETGPAEFPAPAVDGGAFERRRREDPAPPSGPAVAIRVHDTGVGIAPEHLPALFDPFFTTKEPGRGTGLGLAISRSIVEAMGGRMLVTSEPGRGSTFTVLLPPADPSR